MATITASETPLPTRGAQLFQPPKSPSSTAASPALAASSTTDYFSSRARKRQRPDSSHSQTHDTVAEQHTPWSAAPSWVQCATPSDAAYLSSGAAVNERYRLAGGYDTPGLLATSETEHTHDHHEFRRCVRDVDPPMRQESGKSTISGPLARERNGVARMPSSPNGDATTGKSWTRLAFGLVGKVFTFGSSVIKGFYAGGGKGFDLQQQYQPQRNTPPTDSWMHSAPAQERIHTPVPGAWQSDEFLGDLEQDNPHSPTIRPRPPNKRRQTDRDSWVLVGTPEVPPLDTSPKRKPSSSTPRPSLGPRSSASRANSRRNLAPISRRQSSYTTYTGSPAQHPAPVTHLEAPPVNRRASLAQTRAPSSRPSSSGGGGGTVGSDTISNAASYITPETERYLKRQARQEKAADRTMNSMSKQLEDLIRQGREALGTKVSVEEDAHSGAEEEDEGFVDEAW